MKDKQCIRPIKNCDSYFQCRRSLPSQQSLHRIAHASPAGLGPGETRLAFSVAYGDFRSLLLPVCDDSAQRILISR